MAGRPLRRLRNEGRAWVPHAEGLPMDTLAYWTRDGHLDPERAQLWGRILHEMVDTIPPVPHGVAPVGIFMMGGTASGKSTITKAIPLDDFARLDSDAVKDNLPEYLAGLRSSARDAAAVVHEESSQIVKDARTRAMARRVNILFDGTGKNANGYIANIRDMKAHGYHIVLLMADLDVETAMERAITRAEKTGRWVPPEFITEAYAKIPPNFTRIAAEADEWSLFDTRRRPPVLAWEKTNGVVTIHDPAFVEQFLSRHGGQRLTNSMLEGLRRNPRPTGLRPDVSNKAIQRAFVKACAKLDRS